MPSEYHTRHLAGFSAFVSTGVSKIGIKQIRVEALKADGSTTTCSVRIVPTYDETGKLFLLGYLLDATTVDEIAMTLQKMGSVLERITAEK